MDERLYLMNKPNHLRSASRVPAAPLQQRAVRSTDSRVPRTRVTRRRGTGLVRTLVVASATLAILLVCFSIYQYSQLDPRDAALVDGVRPPSGDGEFPSTDVASNGSGTIGGKTAIGEGERIHLTFYAREGDRAHVELSVSSWTPVAGATNEFLLVRPEIRLRTKTGNGVRVTADQGRLQAPRKAGGGLDLKRGELTGHVVLMLDRLTEAERAKLPPERRDSLDPADVVRIEMDEIDFDLEYSKLIVPGEWHLTARDIAMSAGDLEIRFNEAENRVEYMRTSGGGRIELLQQNDELGLSLAAMNPAGQRSMSLMEWVRASIEARLAATSPAPEPRAATQAPALAFTDDGVPIVNLDASDENATNVPERYYARFDGNVEATERVGDADGARLTADVLEIVREFVDLSRPAGKSASTASAGTTNTPDTTDSAAPTATKPRVVLTWNERLLIEPCTEENSACAAKGRARISASGSPVRITSPDGQAACASLTYDPDGSKVNLVGTDDAPVVVKLGQLGTVIGAAASTERVGDRFVVHVTGPGRLIRNAGTTGALASKIEKPSAKPGDPTAPASDPTTSTESIIAFTDRLDATGRIVKHTRLDFSGRLNTRTERVLDKAVFHGHVRLHEGDAAFGADVLTATFARTGGAGGGQSLGHLLASGHATMTQGDDRLTCREIDVTLSTDPSGSTVPRTVTASGDVEAQQGTRTIQATDRLVMDFTVIDRPFEPFDLKVAHAKAIAAGRDPKSIDWEARKRLYESKPRHQVVAQRLRAFGEVSIVDPDQALDVTAGELDCTIAAGRGIDAATVLGVQDRPATVRLDALTVTGARIVLNVVDQSASVPGPGRLTFLSFKDLDGRQLNRPMPIAVTWHESMAYRGRENRAEFVGNVHAASGSSTTFDCDRLFVEFEDVVRKAQSNAPIGMMALVRTAVGRMAGQAPRGRAGVLGEQVSKAPTYLQAVGHAVARMETFDSDTGELRSRVHIEGPKLSVNLRTDVSKAQIEGPGTLLIEDYRTPVTLAADKAQPPGGLFAIDEHTGSSNTLIEWKTLMWYDFGIQQTRFEGNVRLKYFSGAELARLRGGSTANKPRGRATFLDADVLTIDFLDRNADAKPGAPRRLGRLSADQLRQFQASGHVVLRDDGEGLSLSAGRVVYWKDNNLLGIFGSPTHKAIITTQKPGQLPNQVSVEHVYYNLSTGLQEVAQPTAQGR